MKLSKTSRGIWVRAAKGDEGDTEWAIKTWLYIHIIQRADLNDFF